MRAGKWTDFRFMCSYLLVDMVLSSFAFSGLGAPSCSSAFFVSLPRGYLPAFPVLSLVDHINPVRKHLLTLLIQLSWFCFLYVHRVLSFPLTEGLDVLVSDTGSIK